MSFHQNICLLIHSNVLEEYDCFFSFLKRIKPSGFLNMDKVGKQGGGVGGGGKAEERTRKSEGNKMVKVVIIL